MPEMEKKVLIFRVPEYDQNLVDEKMEEIFSRLPAARELNPGTRVLIKPNLLAKHPPEHGVTTHPAVVLGVIRACKRRGVPAEQITVADSSGGLYNPALMKGVYQASGLWQVCQEEGVECYTQCRYEAKRGEGKLVHQFNLIQPVLEADFIIDLPKMKTHVMTGYTGAVKNLFGCIPGLQKAELHTRFPKKEAFGHMLVDLLELVKPQMAILDGILAQEGDGPAGGTPRKVGLLMASQDLPALDLAACRLIGLDPMEVPYLWAAHERGLCPAAFDPVCLDGEREAFEEIKDYRLPSSYAAGRGSDLDFARYQKLPGFMKKGIKKLEELAAPRPVIRRDRCIGCGKCAEICPGHTIRVEGKAKIDPKGCIRCFCCHEMCPVKAIDVKQIKLFKL